MPKKLTQLEIDEGSLVDAPANHEARMVLFKRDSKKNFEPRTYRALMDARKQADAVLTVKEMMGVFCDSVDEIGMYTEGEDRRRLIAQSLSELTAALGKASDAIAEGKPVEKKEDVMTDEEKQALEKRNEELVAEVADLKAKLAEKEAPAPSEEDVLKAMPEAARKLVEKAKADAAEAVAKAAELEKVAKAEREARELAEFTKRASDELPVLKGEVAEKGRLLKALYAGLEKADADAIAEMLKAANEQIATGKLFDTAGRDGEDTEKSDDDSAASELEKKAAELVKSGKAKDKAEGLVLAAKENPDLYRQHVAESRVR